MSTDDRHNSIVGFWMACVKAGLLRSSDIPEVAGVNTDVLKKRQIVSDATDFINWQLNESSLDHKFNVKVSSNVKPSPVTVWPSSANRYKLAICYGVGVDSTVAALYSNYALKYKEKDVVLVHVDYGGPYSDKERQLADTVNKNLLYLYSNELIHVSANIPMTEQQLGKGYIIPLRNMMLASVGACYGDTVWVIANYRKIDDNPGAAMDKSRKFFGLASEILSGQFERTVTVTSPFMHMSKSDSIQWLRKWMNDYGIINLLELTTTCYHPDKQRCGECFACFKFAMMLVNTGLSVSGMNIEDIEKNPNFVNYLWREHSKGRKMPKHWHDIIHKLEVEMDAKMPDPLSVDLEE